jgi:hypothetical protein
VFLRIKHSIFYFSVVSPFSLDSSEKIVGNKRKKCRRQVFCLQSNTGDRQFLSSIAIAHWFVFSFSAFAVIAAFISPSHIGGVFGKGHL